MGKRALEEENDYNATTNKSKKLEQDPHQHYLNTKIKTLIDNSLKILHNKNISDKLLSNMKDHLTRIANNEISIDQSVRELKGLFREIDIEIRQEIKNAFYDIGYLITNHRVGRDSLLDECLQEDHDRYANFIEYKYNVQSAVREIVGESFDINLDYQFI